MNKMFLYCYFFFHPITSDNITQDRRRYQSFALWTIYVIMVHPAVAAGWTRANRIIYFTQLTWSANKYQPSGSGYTAHLTPWRRKFGSKQPSWGGGKGIKKIIRSTSECERETKKVKGKCRERRHKTRWRGHCRRRHPFD